MDELKIKDILRERDLKATSPRLNILQTILEYRSAIPFSSLQQAMKSLDRVTLYRTIESLKDKGIIHKAYQEDNESYYALCDDNCSTEIHHHEHLHFKCNKCLKVSCIKQKINISIPNYEVHQVSMHLSGICKNCRN